MGLLEIRTHQHRQTAVELLREGFPGTGPSFWECAWKSPEGRSGHGILLEASGIAVGVLLLFQHERTSPGLGVRPWINLSSWYIRPEARGAAFSMLRQAVASSEAVYTDFSASRDAARLVSACGFHEISSGEVLSVPLINGWSRTFSWRFERWNPGPFTQATKETNARLEAHVRAHHWVLQGTNRGQNLVIAFSETRWRRMRVAKLLYASDHALARMALPALHLHLLARHGVLGVQLPRIGPLVGLRSIRPPRFGCPWLIKGNIAPEEIDLLGSECLWIPTTR